MNIAMRKLALLEKRIIEEEEKAKIQGFSTCPIDYEFKHRVKDLMDRIRVI
jgi:hypothetical protein